MFSQPGQEPRSYQHSNVKFSIYQKHLPKTNYVNGLFISSVETHKIGTWAVLPRNLQFISFVLCDAEI